MNPTVLITGASQGIGKATALLFARQGYNLVLSSRSSDRLASLAEELRQSHHAAITIPTDVRDPNQVAGMVEKAIAAFCSIDVLVNNAGVYISGPVEEFTLEDWHTTLDTNLWGYIHTIHALLPHFLHRGTGTIINVGSLLGKMPSPYLVPYTTSKYAITGLTESLHSELSAKGIHVGGVYPNLIRSDFLERAIFRGKDRTDAQSRRQQVEQILTIPAVEKPEDVAKAIWEVVAHQKEEVVVGSASPTLASHRIFPDLIQWIMRKTFQHHDRAAK